MQATNIKNKQQINTNIISKIWASELTLQEMDSENLFMISCITTLIIFVLCSGKFSPSTKSSRL